MLKIRQLEKSYGSMKVLKGLDMTVNSGDVYGFLGKNGCGKTTTMNIVTNIIRKDHGTIKLEKENAKIRYLPETPSLFTYMNGYEYLAYIAACCKYDKSQISKRIDEVLALTGMTEGAKRQIKGYSRGMNQRMGIAATIFDHPDLLILDEPTSALDPQGRAEVMSIITRLAQSGTTIILCTHILSDVERVANRIGIMRDGVLALEGDINEIKNSCAENNKSIRLCVFGDPEAATATISAHTGGNFSFDRQSGGFEIPIDPAADEKQAMNALLKAVADAGLTPMSIDFKKKTLEEIYIETIN